MHIHLSCSNPETSTIEGVLEDAIVKAGGISELNALNLQKVGWGRCARTDKGVHAAAQIITLKVSYEFSTFIFFYSIQYLASLF